MKTPDPPDIMQVIAAAVKYAEARHMTNPARMSLTPETAWDTLFDAEARLLAAVDRLPAEILSERLPETIQDAASTPRILF